MMPQSRAKSTLSLSADPKSIFSKPSAARMCPPQCHDYVIAAHASAKSHSQQYSSQDAEFLGYSRYQCYFLINLTAAWGHMVAHTCMCSRMASWRVSSCVPASRASQTRSSGSLLATSSGLSLCLTTSLMPKCCFVCSSAQHFRQPMSVRLARSSPQHAPSCACAKPNTESWKEVTKPIFPIITLDTPALI